MSVLDVAVWMGLGFVAGSIPFAVLISYVFTGKDIRKEGSGNPGATNVYRVAGPLPGILVLVLDVTKGFVPTFLPDSEVLKIAGGVSAVLGHIFSPFLKFRGGKGVATFLGFLLAIDLRFFLIFICAFVAVVALTGYVSAGSIIAGGISVAFLGWYMYGKIPFPVLAFVICIYGLICLRHLSNIKRLIEGKENKFSLKKKAKA